MLPKRMAIRHGGCYLRSVHEEGNGVVVQLGAAGGGANDPRCRFYLEASKEHDDDAGLTHVVCCHNNKYWVPRQLRGHDGCWIIGTADEAEEDLSKPSCTLFNLHILPAAATQHEERSIRFRHCMLGKCVAVLPSSDTSSHRPYLHVAHGEADVVDAFTFLDLSQHKQLPKYLAFKGDNGWYLGVESIRRGPAPVAPFLTGGPPPCANTLEYLQFASKNMVGDPRVVHTSFTNDDGTVCIKSDYADKFWSLQHTGFIRADMDDKNREDTLFQVIADDDTDEVGANFIILRNQGKICKRLPTDGAFFYPVEDCLSASDDSITQSSRLQVEEAVISRLIYDVEFHLREARIYTKEVREVDARTFDNNTASNHTVRFSFTDTHTEAKTWSNSTSIKGVVKTTFKAPVPCIVDGKVELSVEGSYSRTWGGTETETKTRTTDYTAPVPPHTRLTVRAVASKGACDVPYSYKQKDVLLGGEVVIHEFHDGIYSGVSTEDLKFEVKEEKLKSHDVVADAS